VGRGGGGATLITLTTDFGLADPWVGIMKGVIATRAPGTPVVDVSHGVPPQDVFAGALVLRHAVPWFPRGTIHVAVVDPGVGSERRALCIETDAALLVGPDNGLLSLAAPPAAVRRIVELADERFFVTPRSRTFHGRDVFAPVAAALATGTDPGALGPTRAELVRLTLPEPERQGTMLRAQVIYVDRFGNLVTNVPGDALAPERVSISIANARIRGIATSYAATARGTLVAVVNSWNLLEIAVRDGSAQERLGVGAGAPLTLDEA
jgi:S-adenosyl-L-methionine hydrolase (adenosine-forming)